MKMGIYPWRRPLKIQVPRVLALIIVLSTLSSCLGSKCPPPENIMPCRCRGRNDQIQVWCSHSDLERVNGALENLMRLRSMPAIDELIVENNKMPTLPARAFGALQIGRLLLRNNGLESLSRNAFAGLEDSLEEIYIVEEKLVDFPFDSIEKLRNLEAFSVEKSRIRLLPRFGGLNRLKHIRIDGSLISGFPVGAFASMSSIKQIHVVNSGVDRLAEGIFGRLDSLLLANFTGNRIDHIQRRCFNLLPRLEILSLGSNKLNEATTVGRSMEELGSLKSLDLSNNQFKELPEGSFANLRSLQLLNLAGNQVSRVNTRSFTHLPALRKVDLSQNLLRNFPKMMFDTTPLLEELRMRSNQLSSASEISEMLTSLQSLRYLDLGQNGLKELPSGAIKDHSHLMTLDLSDNQLTSLHPKAFHSLPSLQELSLRNNSIVLSPSLQVWDIPSLKELDFSHNRLGSLTPSSLSGLPALQRLDLSHNLIKSIGQSPFAPTPDLEYLSLQENELTSLSSEGMNGLKKLERLDLSRNQLEQLQPSSFRDLRSLVSLNLGNNRVNQVPQNLLGELGNLEELNLRQNSLSFIPQGFFQSLKKLKDLNLKHNSIAEVNQRLFSGLDSLEQLRLSWNQIRQVDDGAFDHLTKLRGVDLSNNRLARLTSRSLRHLPLLEKLEARENRISVVEEGVLQNTEGLQILDLAHNALTQVPVVLRMNPLLKVVDLSHNQIQKLDKDIFSKLGGLMELYLNDNKITTLLPGTFENLGSLTIVDLDGNELDSVASGSFSNLPRLIYLRMSRNRIRSIGRGGFSNLNSLDGLDLQENDLEEISPGGFDKTGALKYLNLSHNNLDKMGSMGLLTLGSLEVLDLSYNKLSSVDTDALRHLIWLVELRMNDNGICRIPPGTFDGMSRLKMLVLRNNRLKHLYESVFYKLRNNIAFLDVSGNPLECDCEMTWLRNLMAREELQELSDSICDSPTDLKGVAVKLARPGRMICTGGKRTNGLVSGFGSSTSSQAQDDLDCPPLTKSKRRPRPASAEPGEERPIFGNNVQDDFYTSDGQNEAKFNNRRKDEKLIESNDYISGDTPTIYAGSSSSSTKATAQDHQKSSGGGGIPSFFGIPLDFGFNFGISPAFSWADKKKDSKAHKQHKKSSPADPLPPSWIERPSKSSGIKNVYEAPEYLPRKPSQPYIPLNPAQDGPTGAPDDSSSPEDSQRVEPSGSVDVHKTIVPYPNKKIRFPEDSSHRPPPPKSSWHPNYTPNTETGFIPIEPFFHNSNPNQKRNKTNSNSKKSSEDKYYPIKSTSTEKYSTTTLKDKEESPAGSPGPSSEEYDDPSSNTYTPVQTTEVDPNQTKDKGSDDFSLSDFWGMFTPKKNQSRDQETLEGTKDTESYEDDQPEVPFNFSAPVDQPIQTPEEPEEEQEYNIPFGGQGHTSPSSGSGSLGKVTGRPTITKIIETDPPSFHNSNRNHKHHKPEVELEPEDISDPSGDNSSPFTPNSGPSHHHPSSSPLSPSPSSSPLIPPVIIGGSDTEPRDWYYTNYHKPPGGGGGDELLERLLQRSNQHSKEDLVSLSEGSRLPLSTTLGISLLLLLPHLLI